MSNHKSFVFHQTSDSQSLVIPSEGRYHLYINKKGLIEVIDHKGRLVPQRTGMIGSNDVFDESQYGGENVTEVLNVIIDVINGLSAPSSVTSINGESGDVTLDGDKIDLANFFIFSIGDSIRNGIYRKAISGDYYVRIDVADQAQNTITKVNVNSWTIQDNGTFTFQATSTGDLDPTLPTEWIPYGGGLPVKFAVTTLHSGSTQELTEKLARSIDESRTIFYHDRIVNSYIDAIYTSSTSNGNWVVYPTTDSTEFGAPLFSEVISAAPVSFSNTISTISNRNTMMMSGSCYNMPAGTNAANGTIVQLHMKGIKA